MELYFIKTRIALKLSICITMYIFTRRYAYFHSRAREYRTNQIKIYVIFSNESFRTLILLSLKLSIMKENRRNNKLNWKIV